MKRVTEINPSDAREFVVEQVYEFIASRQSQPFGLVMQMCHAAAVAGGWWQHHETGDHLDRNVGELLMLSVSELSEAMEGHRKGVPDDKLPHRSMFEVELADTVIRVFDLAAAAGIDLELVINEKVAYNLDRTDFTPEERAKPGGKKY